MRVLLVYCHPVPESFCAAVRDAALAGLAAAGHAVDVLDLYSEGFDPVMPADERRRYNAMATRDDNPYPGHADRLMAAQAIVFIYPTWWHGLPAMLKGWLDRVWTPGVAFTVGPGGAFRPRLRHIRAVGVVTTFGGSRFAAWLAGQPGRRTLLRGMRALFAPGARTLFLAHYNADAGPPEARAAFLETVRNRMARF